MLLNTYGLHSILHNKIENSISAAETSAVGLVAATLADLFKCTCVKSYALALKSPAFTSRCNRDWCVKVSLY